MIRARVVCCLCGKVLAGRLQTWPFAQDPAERWRVSWHKRTNPHGGTMACPGWWRFDHRRFDEHRQSP